MKAKLISVIVLLFVTFNFSAQTVYFQDIFKGGVCVVGTSTHDNSGEINLPYYIEPLSSIKKIFLVTYSLKPLNQDVYIDSFIIDNQSFKQDSSNFSGTFVQSNFPLNPSGTIGSETHVTDITNTYSPQSPTINIKSNIINSPISCPSCRYAAPVLIILYENVNLPLVNYAMVLNSGTESNNNAIQLNNVNACHYSTDIGIGIHSDRLSGFPGDCYNFSINTNYTSILNGPDNLSIGNNGVIGCFYYQNNTLYGLTDDVADDSIHGSDGIMRLNNYITTLNGTEIDYSYCTVPNDFPHNVMVGFNLAYSTPCDAFSVSHSQDTAICQGENVSLFATGGQAYKWEPATDLSCSTCPNPVFTGNNSQVYRVTIYNNDSCSVVRPIRVTVRQKPLIENIVLSNTICGTNTGVVSASSSNGNVSPISFMVNNGAPQASGSFLNLNEGTHTITLQDGYGCKRDSVVIIGQVNNTIAQFSANPITGAVPFSVNLTNTSVFADQFSWSLNGVNQGSTFSNFTAIQTGSYLIELIAWQFDPACADTATLSITAFDSLMVQVPNIITANDDLINDFFALTTNLPLKGTVSILNRWGEVVYTYNGTFQQGQTVLWDGKFEGENVTEGTYFYTIELNEDPEFPLAIDKSQLPLKLEGFVEVRR